MTVSGQPAVLLLFCVNVRQKRTRHALIQTSVHINTDIIYIRDRGDELYVIVKSTF